MRDGKWLAGTYTVDDSRRLLAHGIIPRRDRLVEGKYAFRDLPFLFNLKISAVNPREFRTK